MLTKVTVDLFLEDSEEPDWETLGIDAPEKNAKEGFIYAATTIDSVVKHLFPHGKDRLHTRIVYWDNTELVVKHHIDKVAEAMSGGRLREVE